MNMSGGDGPAKPSRMCVFRVHANNEAKNDGICSSAFSLYLSVIIQYIPQYYTSTWLQLLEAARVCEKREF